MDKTGNTGQQRLPRLSPDPEIYLQSSPPKIGRDTERVDSIPLIDAALSISNLWQENRLGRSLTQLHYPRKVKFSLKSGHFVIKVTIIRNLSAFYVVSELQLL